jgi:outer membrane protein assembly factor BamB
MLFNTYFREDSIISGNLIPGILLILLLLFSSSVFAVEYGRSIDLDDKLAPAIDAYSDEFGYSVAMDGDTVITGAPWDDEKGTDCGAAYVFHYDGESTWTLEAKLLADFQCGEDLFGFSVDVSGDTAIIGTYISDPMGYCEGRAFIFQKIGGIWTQVAQITGSPSVNDNHFGNKVAISCDTVVVVAPAESNGAAYVFERNEGGANAWGQKKIITGSDAVIGDEFGISIAISGDTIVIGAQGHDAAANNAGAAYVFERNEGGADNWGQKKKLLPVSADAGDRFGCSVDISGDLISIGALGDDSSSLDTGTVYIFDRDNGGTDNWGYETRLTAAEGQTGDALGFSVAISGDNVITGAINHSNPGPGTGAAYVFKRQGASDWIEQAKLIAADGNNQEFFAFSVDVSSGDKFVAGVNNNAFLTVGSGSAYILQPFKFAWVTDPHIMPRELYSPPMDAMDNFLPDIQALSSTLDFAINTGDLTERGFDEDILLFKDTCTSMTVPYYYIPGNHETRWTENAFVNYNNVLGEEHFFFKHQGIYFIGINDSVFCRIAIANIAPQEQKWLADRLAEMDPPGSPVVLCLHHNPGVLLNDNALFNIIRDYNITLILAGHNHNDIESSFYNIPVKQGVHLFGYPYRYKIVEMSLSKIDFYQRYCGDTTDPLTWTVDFPVSPYPALSVTGLTDEDIVSGNVHIDIFSTDSLTLCEYEITNYFDGFTAISGSGQSWQADIDTSTLPNGEHWLKIRFNNGSGDWFHMIQFISENDYPKSVWTTKINAGIESSPICVNSRVFFGADDGKIYGLNLTDGTECWAPVQTGGPVISSPAVYNGNIFVGSADGKLYVIDIISGVVQWTYQTANAILSSPVAEDGAVYFGSNDRNMYGLDIATQAQLWPPFSVGGKIDCKPCLDNGALYFGCFDTYLYSLNTSTGTMNWRWQPSTSWYSSPAYCWPVVAAGKVFVSRSGGYKTAVDINTGMPIWESNSPAIYTSIGISEDKSRFYGRSYNNGYLYAWDTSATVETQIGSTYLDYGMDYGISMPVEKDGTIFTGSQKGFVVAVDATTGDESWHYFADSSLTNTVYPIDSNSVLVTTIGGVVSYISNSSSPPSGVENWELFSH